MPNPRPLAYTKSYTQLSKPKADLLFAPISWLALMETNFLPVPKIKVEQINKSREEEISILGGVRNTYL